jgi:LemA protein
MKKLSSGVILLGVVVLLMLFTGYTYNRLVSQSEGIEGQWAQVETQYQRRFDLIPNLVSSVQGTMRQEQAVFSMIADARTKYAGAATPRTRAAAAVEVESSLARLLVVMENYPQLKSAENVQTLMAQLEGTENRVAVERGRYNEAVRSYNARVRQFPSNVIASAFGFDEWAYFEAVSGAQEVPKVDLIP